MTRLITLLLVLGTVLLSYPVGKKVADSIRSSGLTQTNESSTDQLRLPRAQNELESKAPDKTNLNLSNVELGADNTVTFRGPVLGATVSKAIKEISAISRNLPESEPIYLVMDTPGGSIMEGADFIDFLDGIPQEVRTITLFSASMGFHIVESNKGQRLITRNGVLMSHRAKGGVEGQFDGELETEYKMIKRKIDYLELVAATRLGLTLSDYKAKIKDEYWVHGFDAKDEKVADGMVSLRCGASMKGEDELTVQTMFGPLTVIFDKCPLIRDPIRVELAGIKDVNSKAYVQYIVNLLIYDKEQFVKQVIETSKFNQIFP